MPKHVASELYSLHKHPKIGFLGPAKFPAQQFENFHAGHHWNTDSRLLFQK